MRAPASRAARLAWILAIAAGCGDGGSGTEVQEIEKAYAEILDAVLRDDDETFFRMHCREAREEAMRDFPALRERVLARPPAERRAFAEAHHVTVEEFATGDPKTLVVKLMPWQSGWKAGREVYRKSPIQDVRIEKVPLPGGGEERRGVVVLDPNAAFASADGRPIPEKFRPKVVFVKDPEGWRRKYFFTE